MNMLGHPRLPKRFCNALVATGTPTPFKDAYLPTSAVQKL